MDSSLLPGEPHRIQRCQVGSLTSAARPVGLAYRSAGGASATLARLAAVSASEEIPSESCTT